MEYSSLDDFRERAGYEIGGRWYPRITSIVSIKAKPALYRYYASQPSFRAADEAKERSAAEGTLLHATVEAIMKGMPIEVDPVIGPAVDAFLEFRRHHELKPILIEERVLSTRHDYAGTLDVYAEVDGRVGVLDIKTSLAVYRDYGLQIAAYREALSERDDLPRAETSWILRLDQAQKCERCGATMRHKGGNTKVRGGKYRCGHQWSPTLGEFEFKEVDDFDSDLRGFLAAKELWSWEHRNYLARVNG